MKQRISVEQLSELTAEQKDRLNLWWKPESYDVVYDTDSDIEYVINIDKFGIGMYGDFEGSPYTPKTKLLPLMSIGQCIELLKNNNTFKWNYDEGSFAQLPGAFITLCWDERDCPEFIDALWQAVKEIL